MVVVDVKTLPATRGRPATDQAETGLGFLHRIILLGSQTHLRETALSLLARNLDRVLLVRLAFDRPIQFAVSLTPYFVFCVNGVPMPFANTDAYFTMALVALISIPTSTPDVRHKVLSR